MPEYTREQLKDLMVGAVAQYAKRKRTDVGRGSPTMGAVLSRHLDQNGYSQRAFAAAVGVHSTFVNKVCRGFRGISIETLAEWHTVLGDSFVRDWLGQLRRETRDAGD